MMFRKMRKEERQLTEAEAEQILQTGEYGILSLNGCGEEGYPYGVPVSYAYRDGHIYIHGATEGAKVDRIAADDRVSFCVVGPTQVLPQQFSTIYASAIAFGRAVLLTGDEKLAAFAALTDKYAPEFREKGHAYAVAAQAKTCVYRIDIGQLTGKARKA